VQLLPAFPHIGDAPLPFAFDERLIGLQLLDFGIGVAAEHDVRAAPGHVGRDRDLRDAPGLHDDLGFARVLLRVQHVVLHLFLLQHRGEQLRVLDRGRAHEDRLALRRAFLDVVDDRLVLFLRGDEDLVVQVLAHHRPVRRNEHGFQVVDRRELESLGVGGAGHAGELLVQAEVVLERDRGERLALVLDRGPFLRLDGLVQPIGPAAAGHHAAGELVDDDHFVVLDDVMLVAVIQRVRPDPRVKVMHEDDVGRIVEARPRRKEPRLLHQLFGVLVAQLRERDRVHLQVGEIVARRILLLLLRESRDQLVDAPVELRGILGLPGNDEGRARLVDQDRVDLVDDRVVQPALEALRDLGRHVVAQVIEAEFVVGAVGDVGLVGRLLIRRIHLRHDHAHREAEEAVDAAHPLGVALGEVIVDGDDVNALALERVQVGRQRRDERLAFAGAHLGDLAFVQRDAADHLDVEVAHLQHPFRHFAHHREGLGEHIRSRGAGGDLLLELWSLRAQLVVGELLELRLERVDGADGLPVLLEESVVAAAEDGLESGIEHGK